MKTVLFGSAFLLVCFAGVTGASWLWDLHPLLVVGPLLGFGLAGAWMSRRARRLKKS